MIINNIDTHKYTTLKCIILTCIILLRKMIYSKTSLENNILHYKYI